MRTRRLGHSSLELSTIGLGTWAIGGPWAYGWGPQDDAESISAIQKALDLGINWIDVAAVYGLGHAEKVVGQAIKGRKQPIIATKCGLCWRDNGAVYPSLKAASVRKEVEASLKRLDVEVIDLYQIHWPTPEPDIEEGWGEVKQLIDEGKIRYAGVCNFNVEQLKRAQAIHPVVSLQPPYSMIDTTIEASLPYCSEHQVGVVAYSPMQAGLLTGKFSQERMQQLDAGDWRHKSAAFREPIFGKALTLVEKLTPIAADQGYSMAQLALAWVLRRPEVTSAIVGARRPSQIEETAKAGDWELDQETLQRVEAIRAEVAVPIPKSIR